MSAADRGLQRSFLISSQVFFSCSVGGSRKKNSLLVNVSQVELKTQSDNYVQKEIKKQLPLLWSAAAGLEQIGESTHYRA